MYGQIIGRGGAALPAVASTSAVVATTLPVTGPNIILEVAITAAAGLAVWAAVYGIVNKLQAA